MIIGAVTSELEAVLTVRLQSAGGRSETVSAVIDTGFDGFIALPPDLIAQMQLPFAGSVCLALADGNETWFRTFEVIVHWQGERFVVPAAEMGAGALVGMALLHGSRLTMDVLENGPVRIEPLGQSAGA